MPRQNRVTPTGELVATPARGLLMGNRGCLHDAQGQIRRHHVGRRWICCRLSFQGRHRAVMTPGRYTELFFLDEATALAAGHRPCAECLRERFHLFRSCWAAANPALAQDGPPDATMLDSILHAERLSNGQKATHQARLSELPPGTFVQIAGADTPCLITDGVLLAWSAAGYARRSKSPDAPAAVLTPPSVVNMLARGYPCHVHPAPFEP